MLEASINIITKNIIPARLKSPTLEKRFKFNRCSKKQITGSNTNYTKKRFFPERES
jgi:hypothetical protein